MISPRYLPTPFRAVRDAAERWFVIIPAMIISLLLPRNWWSPISFVFRFKARRSIRRAPIGDKISHSRVLAQFHDEAGAKYQFPDNPLARTMIRAHREAANYCRQLFSGSL